MPETVRSKHPEAAVSSPKNLSCWGHQPLTLFLCGHGIRVDRLFAGNALEPGEDGTIVVLIALDREAALRIPSRPRQTDVVLL
jgi:hypothetical protein